MNKINKSLLSILIFCALVGAFPLSAKAASNLSLSPASGSYVIGNNFPVVVKINTNSSSINAAEAYLTFDKTKFTISSLDTSSSIFMAWPKLEFSNSAGTIHFAGGLPSPGFNGPNGSVLVINFKGIALGTGDVSFDSGSSVLLNDGIGTEDFGTATGGSYTIIPPALAVSCGASPSSVNVNSSITFKANATGESGVYTYSWSGACVGSSASCTKSFTTTGTKTATVVATSNGKTASTTCSANVGFPGLSVSCSSPDSVDVNQPITFKSSVSGGSGSYDYLWSDACSGTSSDCTGTYDKAGLKKAKITVTSGGKTSSAECSFAVGVVCAEGAEPVTCPVCEVPANGTAPIHSICSADQKCVPVLGYDKDQCQTDKDCEIINPVFMAPIEVIQIADKVVKKNINTPEISVATKAVSTAGAAVAVLPLLEMFLMPLRLMGVLIGGLGIRRRAKPWGVVYDSVTKQPIDPAFVTLKYADDGKDVSSSITDLDGRYGFFVDPDSYKISASKTNYIFPSKILAGKKQDELYDNLYFGENVYVKQSGEVITKNIPLDPVNFDWNEFSKKDKKLMTFYSKWDAIFRKLFSFIFVVGFIVAIISFFYAPYPYNTIIMALYLIMLLLRFLGIKPRPQGYIVDRKTGIPLAFAIIRVMMAGSDIQVASKSADRYGRYYCLVPPGKYYVKIEKKERDGSYSLVYTSSEIDVSRKGIIKEKFKV